MKSKLILNAGKAFGYIAPLLLLCATSSCKHEGDITQFEPVSYSYSIKPMIESNCNMSGCHDGGEEFSLKTYNELMGIVTPGNSTKSELYKVITASWDSNRMPPGDRGPLSKEQRSLIDVWIEQGALNDENK